MYFNTSFLAFLFGASTFRRSLVTTLTVLLLYETTGSGEKYGKSPPSVMGSSSIVVVLSRLGTVKIGRLLTHAPLVPSAGLAEAASAALLTFCVLFRGQGLAKPGRVRPALV